MMLVVMVAAGRLAKCFLVDQAVINDQAVPPRSLLRPVSTRNMDGLGCVALLQQMTDDATGIERSALVRSAAAQIVRLGLID